MNTRKDISPVKLLIFILLAHVFVYAVSLAFSGAIMCLVGKC